MQKYRFARRARMHLFRGMLLVAVVQSIGLITPVRADPVALPSLSPFLVPSSCPPTGALIKPAARVAKI